MILGLVKLWEQYISLSSIYAIHYKCIDIGPSVDIGPDIHAEYILLLD